MVQSIDEATSGRLELTGARARALLGTGRGGQGSHESTEGGPPAPGTHDEQLLAARISRNPNMAPAAAAAIAADIVERARVATAKLEARPTDADLNDHEVLALESVMHVRGRPALRVYFNRLESLAAYPGSEFWQEFVAQYEDRIVAAAAATGAAVVSAFSTGNPPWVQGSAWLVAPDRVVTNRHVLVSPRDGLNLVERAGDGSVRFRAGDSVTIEFAADDRTPSARIQRRVTGILYLANPEDPVDIAVLAIEPQRESTPLSLALGAGVTPNNLFVVGHPALMAAVPDDVQAVFGRPDGRKRVSFGKRLEGIGRRGEIVYDASTVGGYSGGPVLGISDGTVAGLHYYGDPVGGNLAVTAATIRAHRAYAALTGTNQ